MRRGGWVSAARPDSQVTLRQGEPVYFVYCVCLVFFVPYNPYVLYPQRQQVPAYHHEDCCLGGTMESEGPSAPKSEDRWVKTVIRLAQLCPALDRPTPEETGGTWTGRPTTGKGALARAKETRRLQPRQKSPRFQLHHGASKSSRPRSPSLQGGADNFK